MVTMCFSNTPTKRLGCKSKIVRKSCFKNVILAGLFRFAQIPARRLLQPAKPLMSKMLLLPMYVHVCSNQSLGAWILEVALPLPLHISRYAHFTLCRRGKIGQRIGMGTFLVAAKPKTLLETKSFFLSSWKLTRRTKHCSICSLIRAF